MKRSVLILGLILPALYIAFSVYHPDWIPETLGQVIQKNRVQFSPVWEVLGLLLAFELLQESGVHLPQAIGQSVSTIGGIVVGTAAVEAGLISPVVLIVVSIAGVCGFVLPNRDLANALRLWRFLIAILSSFAGLYGTVAGAMILLIHLSGLKSLGISYLSPTGSILRKRLVKKKYRCKKLHPEDRRNQK